MALRNTVDRSRTPFWDKLQSSMLLQSRIVEPSTGPAFDN